MIRRIVLENYMAHVHTVIEPAEGLTAIIGPNNCGKSAIIHALEMICYNSDAADFAIRHGTKKATVTIETEDADGTRHTLVWWRSRGSTGYSIDGREITGVGRAVPDDLHDFLRMPKIEPSAGGDPFLVHFGMQKDPIFLLDDPASRAAHFFASSSDADKLVEMQKRHAQKSAGAKRDKEKLDARIGDLDRQLSVLAPLPDMGTELSRLEEDHLKLVAMGEAIEALEQSIGELDRASERELASRLRLQTLTALQRPPEVVNPAPLAELVRGIGNNARVAAENGAMLDILAELKALPELKETAGLATLCRQFAEYSDRLHSEQQKTEALRLLQPLPILSDVAAMRKLADEIDRAAGICDCCEARVSVLVELVEAPRLQEVAPLVLLLDRFEKLGCESRRDEAQHRALSNLQPAPQTADVRPLTEMIRRLESAIQLEATGAAAVESAQLAAENLRAEIEVWVEDHPRCSACGQPISAELILSGGHDHE